MVPAAQVRAIWKHFQLFFFCPCQGTWVPSAEKEGFCDLFMIGNGVVGRHPAILRCSFRRKALLRPKTCNSLKQKNQPISKMTEWKKIKWDLVWFAFLQADWTRRSFAPMPIRSSKSYPQWYFEVWYEHNLIRQLQTTMEAYKEQIFFKAVTLYPRHLRSSLFGHF